MVGIGIEFPRDQITKFEAQMRRGMTELGKSEKEMVKWGALTLAKSLSASTKRAPKLRPIVKNPSDDWKTDGRKARFGVFKWKRGVKYFSPLGRTGEFGRYKYVDKHTLRVMQVDKATGKRVPYEFSDKDEGAEKLAMAKHKKRIIGRRGLAAAAWARVLQKNGGNGASKAVGAGVSKIINRTVEVTKRLEGINKYIMIQNRLRYALDAFKTDGEKAVSFAVLRATDAMAWKIQDAMDKKKVFG